MSFPSTRAQWHTGEVTTPLRLALLGDPVGHSLSPAIHRAALREAGLEGSYQAIQADETVLDETLGELRRGVYRGLNITMPLKEPAARRSDVLTVQAEQTGSVNSLRIASGKLEGHSTDAVAMSRLLGERFDSTGPVLVLGSGATAAVALMAVRDRSLYVAARNPERVTALGERLGRRLDVIPFGSAVVGAVVVNATPLGMNGEELPPDVLQVAAGLIDLPYGVSPTPAVTRANELGIPVVDGVEFLVTQAAFSFQWWTGITPVTERLLEAARDQLAKPQISQEDQP